MQLRIRLFLFRRKGIVHVVDEAEHQVAPHGKAVRHRIGVHRAIQGSANIKAKKPVDKLSHLPVHRTGGSKDFLRVILPGEHRLIFVLLLVHRVKRIKNALDKVNVGEVEQHRHLSVDGDFLHSGIMSKFKHCLTS